MKSLIGIYHELNREVFANVLSAPDFRFTRSRGEYASYQATLDPNCDSIINFNSRSIKGHWARSIVYHEMIHQYLEEFLGVEEENHHGPIFWKHYRKFAPQNVILFEDL